LFFENGSSYISAVDLDTSTKFGLRKDFDLRIKVTSLYTKPEVVLSHRCRHLEIVYDVITPPPVARFGRTFGNLIQNRVIITKERRIPTAILKIVLRRIFFCFPNAVWASASGGFRILSDTLVKIGQYLPKLCSNEKGPVFLTHRVY